MSERTSFGFGERLKAARLRMRMSGELLGKGSGEGGKDASRASVSDWEHDRHYPKADQLRVICLKLNISADHLIFGDLKNDPQVMKAASDALALTEEQRSALLSLMLGPAVPDAVVEAKMPKTKTLKGRKRHGDSGPDSGMGSL